MQDKRIAFNFLFLSSPLQPSFMSPSQVKRRIIPDKMFLKKTRRPKTKLTNTPGEKNTKKKPGAKAPGFTNRKKNLLRLQSGYRDSINYLINVAAAGKVVQRSGKALAHRTDRLPASHSCAYLIADVSGIDVRENKCIRMARDTASRSL